MKFIQWKKKKETLSFSWYINKDEKWKKKKKLCCTEKVITSYDIERNRSKTHTCPWWRQDSEWSYNDSKWKEWVNVCYVLILNLNLIRDIVEKTLGSEEGETAGRKCGQTWTSTVEMITFKWGISLSISRLRPYHPEHARSRPISEAKQGRAWLVLGWETAWEYQVL